MSDQPRTVIVTGASGFVGSHLTRAVGKKARVIGLSSRAEARSAPMSSRAEARSAPMSSRAEARSAEVEGSLSPGMTIAADLSQPGWTRALPPSADVVIHLAQSRRYREFPAGAPDMFAVNVAATAELLEWSRAAGVRQFILASTGSVYAPLARALTEDDPTSASSYYAASKLAAESIAVPYREFFAVSVLRLFGPYGPGQRGMLISNMIDKVRAAESIQISGPDGLHLTPLFIDDCVAAITRVTDWAPPNSFNLFNVAGGETITLANVVRTIGRALGVQPTIASNPGDARWVAGDATRFRNATGWRPATDFATGIATTVHSGETQ